KRISVPKNHNSLKFRLKDRLAVTILRSVLRLSALVPLEVARSVGRFVGRLAFKMNTQTVRVVRRNIELAYPQLPADQQAALMEEAVLEQGALTAELGHVWRRSPAYVMSKLRVVGIEHLEAAAADERGVLVLAPHVGNWEVLPHHLVTQGDLLGLFEPPKLPSVGSLVLEARKRPGGAYVPTTPKGLVQLVRHFKRGGLTGILPDQVPAHESGGLNVPFRGIECFTASLCANLLSKSGARAVLAGVFRVKGGWELVYLPVSADIYNEDLEVALTVMNQDIETLISGRDAQYQWSYKRFRTLPRDTTNHYDGVKRASHKDPAR
ncbi:MAG: lysophospholipid acyltransferase family protein, partial [Pseudomonadota bacterium]|nr:lysophospholipid acyltransferase family protein [Pseudomonadota bacterium]